MCHPLEHTGGGNQLGTAAGSGPGTITATVRALMPNHPVCAQALAIAKAYLPASILYHSFRTYMYAQAFLRLFQDTDHIIKPVEPPTTPYAPTFDRDDITPPKTPTTPGFAPSVTIGAALTTQAGTAQVQVAPGYTARAPPHVLFVLCILHDIGTASQYDSVPERFEVVSADIASKLLRSHGISEPVVRDAWLAMSLHTSPGIAERLGGTVRALRLAIRADFGSYPTPPLERLPGGLESGNMIRWQLPRLEIEKELGDAVVRQALRAAGGNNSRGANGVNKAAQKAPSGSWPGDLLREAEAAPPGYDGVNRGF